MSVRNNNGFLKRWFVYFLIFNHLVTPQLLAAKYHPGHTAPDGDFVDDFHAPPHFAIIHKKFVQNHTNAIETESISLHKGVTGSYRLSINPERFKNILNLFITDERQNNEIIGHIISNEKIVSFIGAKGYNFEVENPWDLQSLDVNVGGNLHFLKDVTIHENASLRSNALLFGGTFHADGALALDVQEDIINKASLKSNKNIIAKFNRLENQSVIQALGDIVFQGKQLCLPKGKSIVESNIKNNGSISSEKSISLLSDSLINKKNISSRDLIIKTNDYFNNFGIIEVFGNSQAQYTTFRNSGFTQIQGNFFSQGDLFIGQKNTQFPNNLRVGGIYQANVKNYVDSGENYWDSFAMIQAEHLKLFGKYTCTSAMLHSENGLIIGSEASFQTNHFIGLKSGGTVEFKGDLSIPFAKKPMVSQGPAFDKLSNLIKRMPHAISIEGKKGIRQNGNIDSKTTSISYSTEGNLQLKGRSFSGVFEFNNLEITALNAMISGSLIAHGDVLARIQKDLDIMGELTARHLNALAQNIQISGSLHAHNASLVTEENIDLSSAASLKIDETLSLNAGGYINHEGKTHTKNILAQGTSITNKGDIRARNAAHFKADRYFANLWRGFISAQDLNIDAGLNLNFLSTLHASRSMTINTLLDLNFLGLESAHHISSSSLLSLNMGLCLPNPSLEDIFSWDTLRAGTMAAAMTFFPFEVRTAINLVFATYKIYNQASLLNNRSQNLGRNSRLSDLIPCIVGMKDLLVSGCSAYSLYSELKFDISMPVFSIKNAATAALTPLLPSITQDSLINLNMGLMCSGNVYQRGVYSNNLGYIRARNYTNDVLFATNTGNILGTNILFSNKTFLNKGNISTNSKKRSLETAIATDIGSIKQEDGAPPSKRAYVEEEAQFRENKNKRSLETAIATDIEPAQQENGAPPFKRTRVEEEDQSGGNIRIKADYIKTEAPISAESYLYLQGGIVEQLGQTYSGKGSYIEATQQYIDTEDSRNESGGAVSLIAPENNGFNGQQVAPEVKYELKNGHLPHLLEQTNASRIQAHLQETNMVLDHDLDVTPSLYLKINRFENNANFSANKNFILQTATETINKGSMVAEERMELDSQGTIANSGLMEGATFDAKAPIVINKSDVERVLIPDGYVDQIKNPATMRANNGDLNVEGTKALHGQGGHFEAPEGTPNVKSGPEGMLDLGSQPLEQDVAYWQTDGKTDTYFHQHQRTHHLTQFIAGGDANLWSGTGGTTLNGVAFHSKHGDINHGSAGELRESEVHNISQTDFYWYHKKDTGEDHKYTAPVIQNHFKPGPEKKVNLHATKDIFLQSPFIDGAKSASIHSHNGKVYIDPAISTSMTSSEEFSKNLVRWSHKQEGQSDTTLIMPKFLAEKVDISGAQGVEIGIKNVGNNQALSLDMLENNAETAWVKELRKDPNVTWHLINEDHEKWSQKVQGLTGPAAAVIGITISVATMGTGAALLAIPAASLPGVMASAGFSTLVSQASISLINNQGNIGKVLKEIGSKDSIKSFVTSVASAGITHGLTSKLEFSAPKSNITRHFQQSLVSSGTSASLSILIDKQNIREALLQAAKNVVADTVGGVAANKIGSSYAEGKLDWVTHKLAHGALGGLTGAILSDDLRTGMISGALGGVLSEIIAEKLLDNAKETAYNQALEKAAREGRSLTYQDVEAAVYIEAQKAAKIGRLGTIFTGFGLGLDVNIANRTATNAVNNNFIPFVMVGLSVASALYSGYEVCKAYKNAYEQTGDREVAAIAALEELAKQGVINLAGGATSKLAGKAATTALKAVLKDNPTLAMIFGKDSPTLDNLTDVVGNSKNSLPTVVQQRVAEPDFSTPEAAVYLQIHQSGKGPKAIDTSLFTSGPKTKKTLNGGIRDRKQFWPEWNEKYPGTLSQKNLDLIQQELAPFVDSQWVEYFPEHQNYIGDKIEHHHLDQGALAVPLPEHLHRKDGNYPQWHEKKGKKK